MRTLLRERLASHAPKAGLAEAPDADAGALSLVLERGSQALRPILDAVAAAGARIESMLLGDCETPGRQRLLLRVSGESPGLVARLRLVPGVVQVDRPSDAGSVFAIVRNSAGRLQLAGEAAKAVALLVTEPQTRYIRIRGAM